MKKRGELAYDTLIPWIIGIGVLFLVILFILVLSGKGTAALEYLKNMFRFR